MRSVASGLIKNREHRLVVRFTTLISVVKDVLVDRPAKIVVCHGQELSVDDRRFSLILFKGTPQGKAIEWCFSYLVIVVSHHE
jgi:hypothetical protein